PGSALKQKSGSGSAEYLSREPVASHCARIAWKRPQTLSCALRSFSSACTSYCWLAVTSRKRSQQLACSLVHRCRYRTMDGPGPESQSAANTGAEVDA